MRRTDERRPDDGGHLMAKKGQRHGTIEQSLSTYILMHDNQLCGEYTEKERTFSLAVVGGSKWARPFPKALEAFVL